MISRSQLLDALAHEDFYLRSRVLNRLVDSGDTGPEITKKFIEAINGFGCDNTYEREHLIGRLAHDEATFDWLVEQLLDETAFGPKSMIPLHLIRSFAEGPTRLIQQHLPRLTPGQVVPLVNVRRRDHDELMLEFAAFRLELDKKSLDE